MKVTVLGAGAWGTALAKLLHDAGHSVCLWGHNAEHLREMGRTGVNERYLPGIRLPTDWSLEEDVAAALKGSTAAVLAVPSRVFRELTLQISAYRGVLVSVTKGIEYDTGLTMCGVLRETVPGARSVALSGPTLAMEVARGIPSAIVAASLNEEAALEVQQLFHRPSFRVYTSGDLLGVEMGGALKNVIAIAAGASDGLGFGDNAKAALITRGIAEMRRLGVACGAYPETFSGLSGLGDLTVTCFSRLSRNRSFGQGLGEGGKPEQITASRASVAEGVPTARSAQRLAGRLGVSTPIIEEVYNMLYEGKEVLKALHDLTARDSKAED